MMCNTGTTDAAHDFRDGVCIRCGTVIYTLTTAASGDPASPAAVTEEQASALAEARRSALEEAAKIADGLARENSSRSVGNIHGFADSYDGARRACEIIAHSIRALTEPQHGNG